MTNRKPVLWFFLSTAAIGMLVVLWGLHRHNAAVEITVYKNAQCGCCSKWVEHLQRAGFRVRAHDVEDLAAIKGKYGVPAELASCHTAIAGGYVVEGHVPADAIHRLLKEHTSVRGLAVPGMPIGSPGMEGLNRDHYEIVSFDAEGGTSVYDRR